MKIMILINANQISGNWTNGNNGAWNYDNFIFCLVVDDEKEKKCIPQSVNETKKIKNQC